MRKMPGLLSSFTSQIIILVIFLIKSEKVDFTICDPPIPSPSKIPLKKKKLWKHIHIGSYYFFFTLTISRHKLCDAHHDHQQGWKNVQILQIYLCNFFGAVLIFWPYTCKQTKTLCYYHCAKSIMLKLLCY